MRVLTEISEFDLEIDYTPNARNYIQDALSPWPDYNDPPNILPKQSTLDNVDVIISLDIEDKDQWFQTIKEGCQLVYKGSNLSTF
jgi:hypothetical protein